MSVRPSICLSATPSIVLKWLNVASNVFSPRLATRF